MFDYWHYVTPPLRLVMGGIWIAALLLVVTGRRLGWLRRLGGLPLWPLVPLAGLCFWLFRERTLSGDGLLKVYLLSQEGITTDPYVWKEPLDAFLAHTAADLLQPFAVGAADAVALLSVGAGMLYVAALFWIARLLFPDRRRRIQLTLGLLALGSSQLWFGHVENYSLVTAVAVLTVALALAYQRRQVPLWWVGLAGGTAVSLHPQALFTVPALLLLLTRRRWMNEGITLLAGGLLVPLATVALLRGLGVPWPEGNGFAGDSQLFWRLDQALAPRQLVDALLNLWLLVPPLPLLLPLALWAWRWPQLRQDPAFGYLSALSAGLLLYHFSFQNDLPRPQDWDLFAIVGPGVALWGWYGTLALMGAAAARDRVESTDGIAAPAATARLQTVLIWPVLLFSLVSTAAWVGVNHAYTLLSPDPALRFLYAPYRLHDLAELLPAAAISPAEPICLEPALDPTGCARVTRTQFTIPPDGDAEPVLFAHAPARIAYELALPVETSSLWLTFALDPYAWDWGGDGVTFRVSVRAAGEEQVLAERHLSPREPGGRAWQEMALSLAAYRGRQIVLILETDPGPAGDASGDRAGWGITWLLRGTVRH